MSKRNEINQVAFEEERRIQKLNTIFLIEFGKAADKKTNAMIGSDVIINFDIQRIPEDIRDLFYERLNVLPGEISAESYFRCTDIKIDGDKVSAKLIKNW